MVQYRKPLILKFVSDDSKIEQMDSRTVNVGVRADYKSFKNLLDTAFSASVNNEKTFDYVMVSFDDGFKQNNPDDFKQVAFKLNVLQSNANKQDIRVFNRYNDQLYLLNPKYGKDTEKWYAPSDETVMAKYDAVGDDYEWQKQQADVWQKFANMSPLSRKSDQYNENHRALLVDPKRGLEDDDIKDFFTWKKNVSVVPGLMNNDMVGIRGIQAKSYPDIELFVGDRPVPSTPINLKTAGFNGYVIPMRNVKGDFPNWQIGTDTQAFNIALKATAADGVSIAKSEFFDKKDETFKAETKVAGKYNFKLADGRDSDLHVVYGDNHKAIFEDVNGQFEVSLKEDIKPVLEARGYDLPPLIDKLSVNPGAKYAWPTVGNMIGTKAVQDVVAPSKAGFIFAKEPTNGSDEYVSVLVEGALKGVIVSKYLDHKDANGVSLADKIAGDRGVVVMQIPGVVGKFIASVHHLYTDTDLKIAGSYIAMDADGRENKMVAEGIHNAERIIGQYTKTSILAWDPANKGLDDALLAVANGKINIDSMGIQFGSADQLFPLDQASRPNPYKLDGTRVNASENALPEWKKEFYADKARREANIKKMQNEVQALNSENVDTEAQSTKSKGSETVDTSNLDFAKAFESELELVNEAYYQQVQALVDKYADQIDLSSYDLKL